MYTARPDFGEVNKYAENIGILEITIENDEFGGYILQTEDSYTCGYDLEHLKATLETLTKDLTIRKDKARDLMLVYVDDLCKIKAFFDIEYNRFDKALIWKNIEFRSYKPFDKNGDYDILMDWQNRFNADKYPYVTPSQYVRKNVERLNKGNASSLFPDALDLEIFAKSVHGGVIYSRDNQIRNEKLVGFDITSAYIYSIAFEKHCSSKPTLTDKNNWDLYLKSQDYGTIGVYKITYTSVLSVIGCFKDTSGEKLKKGQHVTVEICLTNIDLKTLITIDLLTIESIECKMLYEFKLDYLPKCIRDYCIDIFMQKQNAVKDSAEYKNIKVMLNSGFFGNFLYSMNKYLNAEGSRSDKKRLYNSIQKDAAVSPVWGIFTMSHVKNTILGLGLQMTGWIYSDTDSIYCLDDSYNRQLIEDYNKNLLAKNEQLCFKFAYPTEAKKLGSFSTDAEIKRFRAWSTKVYCYETIDNKFVIKAAGTDKNDLVGITANTAFEKNWQPKLSAITMHIATDGYYSTIKTQLF